MPPSPVTEIVEFPANGTLKADPKLFAEAVPITAEKNGPAGMTGQAWGFEVEEPGCWHGFLDWPTLEHHMKMIPVHKADKDIQGLFERFLGGPPKVTHVSFSPFDNYRRSLAAPLTEVVIMKVKDGANIQEFKDAIEYALDKDGAAEGCIRGAWGFTVEDEKVAVMVMGWESNEAHLKYKTSETLKDVVARVEKVGELEKLCRIRATFQ